MHNLPWNCTWQNLKDAFAETTQNIERADVITDNTGRSRCLLQSHLSSAVMGSFEPSCWHPLLDYYTFHAHDCRM